MFPRKKRTVKKMKRRTILLNKENYLFLLKLVSDKLESEKVNLDW